MKKYWLNFKTILRHKWFVFLEGLKMHVPLWRLIKHDIDKFYPDEFIAYANTHFSGKTVRDKSGYYDPLDLNPEFARAWFLHQARNDHHWEYWVMPRKDGTLHTIPMSDVAIREMIADWNGAGRTYSGKAGAAEWYGINKGKMLLHPNTRKQVEVYLYGASFEPIVMSKEDETFIQEENAFHGKL